MRVIHDYIQGWRIPCNSEGAKASGMRTISYLWGVGGMLQRVLRRLSDSSLRLFFNIFKVYTFKKWGSSAPPHTFQSGGAQAPLPPISLLMISNNNISLSRAHAHTHTHTHTHTHSVAMCNWQRNCLNSSVNPELWDPGCYSIGIYTYCYTTNWWPTLTGKPYSEQTGYTQSFHGSHSNLPKPSWSQATAS